MNERQYLRKDMILSEEQLDSLTTEGDFGLENPADLYVMTYQAWKDRGSWNFFSYFMPRGSVAEVGARVKPVWQRFEHLFPDEVSELRQIALGHMNEFDQIYSHNVYSHMFYRAYETMSKLVEVSDSDIDPTLTIDGRINQDYVLNDSPGQISV